MYFQIVCFPKPHHDREGLTLTRVSRCRVSIQLVKLWPSELSPPLKQTLLAKQQAAPVSSGGNTDTEPYAEGLLNNLGPYEVNIWALRESSWEKTEHKNFKTAFALLKLKSVSIQQKYVMALRKGSRISAASLWGGWGFRYIYDSLGLQILKRGTHTTS